MSNNSRRGRFRYKFSAGRLKSPGLNVLDQILGLRSWGLIMYGALPASLSLLGFLEVKMELFKKVKLSNVWMLMAILVVSSLPVLLTFLLVRARQKEWYFTSDYLNLRSLITTLLIMLVSTLISGAAGIIRGDFVFSLDNITDAAHRSAMVESFLIGIASLVLSSTIFATILTKGADLPGLPSTTYVSLINGIRQQLIAIRRSQVWQEYDRAAGAQPFSDLETTAVDLLKEFQKVLSQPGLKLAKSSLQPVRSDLDIFVKSVATIKAGEDTRLIEIRWKIHFADLTSLQDENLDYLKNERENIEKEYEALQRLKSLRLGG
jgi:hypothetical protein